MLGSYHIVIKALLHMPADFIMTLFEAAASVNTSQKFARWGLSISDLYSSTLKSLQTEFWVSDLYSKDSRLDLDPQTDGEVAAILCLRPPPNTHNIHTPELWQQQRPALPPEPLCHRKLCKLAFYSWPHNAGVTYGWLKLSWGLILSYACKETWLGERLIYISLLHNITTKESAHSSTTVVNKNHALLPHNLPIPYCLVKTPDMYECRSYGHPPDFWWMYEQKGLEKIWSSSPWINRQ